MSSRHEVEVVKYAWLTESDVQAAGCLTVVVGRDRIATAQAFGVDLGDPVPPTSERWSVERLATVVTVEDGTGAGSAPVSIVLEDNGFEGSREVVLRPSSKEGKAASIFWNVEGLVVFSCARGGKRWWSGELGIGEDLDGLPRLLVRFGELVETSDQHHPVAVGAAMAAAFTGVEVRPDLMLGVPWYAVSPHVEQPTALSAESSGLRWSHRDLVETLAAVAPAERRPLVHLILHAAIRQASLDEDGTVAPVLRSVGTHAPGVITAGFDSWERRWAQESDLLWRLQNDAINGQGIAPLREEELRVYRPGRVAKALRYACHDDDLSALLGIADAAVHIFSLDGHEDVVVEALKSAASSSKEAHGAALAVLPAPPNREDRERSLQEQRRARERAKEDAELSAEAAGWGGRTPTSRMRSSHEARELARRDRDMLDLLDPLPDDLLAAIAAWTARRMLSDAGLLKLPWIQEATRGGADSRELFARLFADPRVVHTTFVDEDDQQCSRQAMALPAVVAFSLPNPYDGACCALKIAGDGPLDEKESLYREVRERFGLDQRRT